MPLDSTFSLNSLDDEDENSAVAEHHNKLFRWIRSKNIAKEDDFDDSELSKIGMTVKREYEIDYQSCSSWRDKYKQYLEFALQVTEEKTYPWPGASNIIFPLLTVASVQFAARAYPAIVNGPRIIKGVVVGEDQGIPLTNPYTQQPILGPDGPNWLVPPGFKREKADRIADHMNWQLLFEQEEWEGDTDTLLHILPIVGSCFREQYFDSSLGRNCSNLITADKLIINYHAKSFALAPRYTKEVLLYPIEIEEKIRAGIFIDQDYTGNENPSADNNDEDAPVEFLEQHRRLDLDDDGYAEPYIVTVNKSTSKVARIVARYDESGVFFKSDHTIARIIAVQYFTPYSFFPSIDGSVYGMGLGQLLTPINAAINTTLNQLVDAGHLQIRGGGFIGKSLSMNTGNVRFAMGEYKSINVSGNTLRENLVPLTFPGPSDVLFQLLGLLIDAGKEVASVKDILTGDVTAGNIQATTMLALIEQGLKVFTAIYKRVYRSLKAEAEKLYRLNSIYLEEESSFKKGEQWKQIKRTDYDNQSGVEPVTDPSMVSDMQKLGKGAFLLQFAENPHFKPLKIYQDVLEWGNFANAKDYLNPTPPPNPALIAKVQELASNASRDRATETKDIAQAILYLAQARKFSDDAHLGWFDQQLELYRMHFEASNQPQQITPPDQPNGPPPPNMPAHPPLEQSLPTPPQNYFNQ